MGTHFLERMTDLIANGLVGKDIKGGKKNQNPRPIDKSFNRLNHRCKLISNLF
jgi:hypothetical protein